MCVSVLPHQCVGVLSSRGQSESAAAAGGGRWRCGRLNKQVSDVILKSETASDSLRQTDRQADRQAGRQAGRQAAVCVEGGAAG